MDAPHCPACKSGLLDEYNRKYRCGSTGPYAGGRIPLERTAACCDIEALRRIADLLVDYCNSNSQPENWRIKAEASDALAAIGMFPADWRKT